MTIGIRPSWACPSYGYIERGEVAEIPEASLTHEAYEVERFREKPAPELAEQFLRQGGFSWNAGMFVWSLPTVIGQLKKHAPDLAEFIGELETSDNLKLTVAERFPEQKPRSIDYALMESADRVLNIEATFDWDDVGSWISVAKYLDRYGEDNVANAEISEFESNDNIVYNARPGSRVALCGVDDLIVVQTADGLPLLHTVHPGNTAETKTLQGMLEKVLEQFPIQRVVLVADRGLRAVQLVSG